jgi:peptidoglycan hydrolase CwlO-like protein
LKSEERDNIEKRPESGVSIALMLDTMELKNFEIQRLKSALLKLHSQLQELEEKLSAKDAQIKRLTGQRDDAWDQLAAMRRD